MNQRYSVYTVPSSPR